MRSRQCVRGYSLIEVLVAMVILAMSLTVLLRIFSGGLASLAVADDYAHAVQIAESRLAAADAAILRPGSESGTIAGRYRWTQTVAAFEPWADEVRVPLPSYTVTVEVSWPSRSGSRTVRLATIKLGRSLRRGA